MKIEFEEKEIIVELTEGDLPGRAATLRVGSVTELAPGETPVVVNSGTLYDAVLDFGLPSGGMIINTAEGDLVTITDAIPEKPVKRLTAVIAPVQTGSGDPSPENIRPISGRTGMTVMRTGKNMTQLTAANESKVEKLTVTYTENSMQAVITGKYARAAWSFPTVIGQRYTLSMHEQSDGNYNRLSLRSMFDEGWNDITNLYVEYRMTPGTAYDLTETFTAVTDTTYIVWYITTNTDTGTAEISGLQLETGSAATAFESYDADELTVSWEDEAGTVYGGSYEVTDGELTVTHGYIAGYDGEDLPGRWISDRDVYAAGTQPSAGAEVVYELAEPLTFQLTPSAAVLKAGINHVWQNSGPLCVTYCADIKAYVDRKIAELGAMIAG